MYFTRYCVLALIVGVLTLQAIPPQINYQGYLTRTDGSPLDTVVTMTFGLYQFQSGGTAVWTQVQNPCTVRAGLFAVSLGPLGSDDPNFQPDTCFLGITVGGNSEMVPRSRLLSVPFAFMVGTLDGADGGHVGGPVYVDRELWVDTLHCNHGIRFSNNTWQSSAWDTTSLSDRINLKADSADNATRSWVQNQGYTSGGQTYPDTITWDATKAWVQSMGYLRGASNNAVWNGFVGGGDNHVAGGQYSTVGGGRMNRARGDFSVIAGGGGGAWVDSNSVTGMYSAVGGGRRHSVAGVASVVSGGTSNSVSGYTSNIGGGEQNSNGGAYSGILGGHSNTIAADADYSMIAGGVQNQISGSRSFAAGWLAHANHDGAFVWADGTGSPFATSAPHQFLIRAMNGVGIGRNNPSEQLDVNGDVRADTICANIGIRFPDGSFQATAPIAFSGQQFADTNTWDATRTWVQNQSYARSWELNPLQADTDTSEWDATKTWVQSMGYLRGAGNTVSPTGFVGGGSNNSANFNFATVSGGTNNAANGDYATVVGGIDNASGPRSAVGGGQHNYARGAFAVIAGGGSTEAADSNSASGDYSAIGGGAHNTSSGGVSAIIGGAHNEATNFGASIGGGFYNKARGQYSVIAGGGGGLPADSNSVSGNYSAIGGGTRNTIGDAQYAAIAGGHNNLVTAFGSSIAGGVFNRTRGSYAFVGGGGGATAQDSNSAIGSQSVIGGGSRNVARAGHGTIAGGSSNTLGEVFAAAISGGSGNNATGAWAVIGGGYSNTSTNEGSTIGGGRDNDATGQWSTVAGGYYNQATGMDAVVCGGESNVAGGADASLCGGWVNSASGDWSFVGGGYNNAGSGAYATVPGGVLNTASGRFSFAAGQRANAIHHGAFVWADSNASNFTSFGVNTFSVRAAGGVRVATTSAGNAGVKLDNGDTAWEVLSDSTQKTNRHAVNTSNILEKVCELPIEEWNYRHQDARNTHIGPMAQDFYRIFGYGDDDKSISTIDPDGIALAAIQALYKEVIELRARVQTLEAAEQKATKEDQ